MVGALGVIYIAVGDNAQAECERSRETLMRYHPDWPAMVLTDRPDGLTSVQASRWHKTALYEQSPFEHTLYLDADTRVYGDISAGFDILRDGWDLVIVPSENQGTDWLWHIGDGERGATERALGYKAVQLQGGAFWFRRNERARCFFALWRLEWGRWRGQDQGALLRALRQQPLKVWLLGRPFNGGAAIGHLFGRARE